MDKAVAVVVRAHQESFASGVDVLFEFGVVQHIPWTWVSSVNGVPVLEKAPAQGVATDVVPGGTPTPTQRCEMLGYLSEIIPLRIKYEGYAPIEVYSEIKKLPEDWTLNRTTTKAGVILSPNRTLYEKHRN